MAILIPAEPWKPVEEVFPADPLRGFTLKELYKLLDTDLVEGSVTLPDGRLMISDELAKLSNPPRPRNERATVLAGFVTPAEMARFLLGLRERGVQVMRVGAPDGTPLDTEVDYVSGPVLLVSRMEFH